ncbi:MAG: hypothetical protein WA794_23035, partial [Trebonia sp.]
YATSGPDGEIPDPVLRWQHHVHQPGIYDLEIDTSTVTPDAAAATPHPPSRPSPNRLPPASRRPRPGLAAGPARFLLLSPHIR